MVSGRLVRLKEIDRKRAAQFDGFWRGCYGVSSLKSFLFFLFSSFLLIPFVVVSLCLGLIHR